MEEGGLSQQVQRFVPVTLKVRDLASESQNLGVSRR
jgi:hypothetical protein